MRKPSVLLINRVYPPVRGATGRVLRDLAQAFARDGWDVTVLTTAAQSGESQDGDVHVHRIAARLHKTALNYVWIWFRLLWVALSLPRHQLVVTLTDPPFLVVAGRLISRIKKSTHIHWCQDLYPDILPALGVKPSPFLMRFLQGMSRRSMKSCDRVVAIGRCMARHLVSTGVDMSRLVTIPNWPDLELTAKAEPPSIKVQDAANSNRARAVLKAKPFFVDEEPKFRVLYAGNIGRAHPVATLLQAAENLLATFPEIEFVFVGEGPGFDALARERASRGLDNIRLLPPQPAARLKDLMESGDVHLISMKHEVMGMLVPSKLYAALAAGRPCVLIGPEQSETARVLKEFGAGQVIPQGNAVALAEAIKTYRLDGDAWFSAQQGALKAAENFTPDGSLASWVKGAREIVRYKAA